ncbi:tRNA 2-thiouridine(34) synthase MnmA [Zavarzinia sp. CC-PAN008]|uniref:tRNA 2-thiouridine(34) synthase MnmA n=1 Tax=Zavarzinia sp. CC-PAN008 TaxID=3243332 RepID=UPI003F74394C
MTHPMPVPEQAFAGLSRGDRVVVAMSGGVDSATVAGLAAQAGFDVVGVTLQLYDSGAAARRAGSCCAGQDVRDARAAAERLGIPHYVLDYEQRFHDQVIAPFADAYAAGETPVPCAACNQTVKFSDLLGFARDLGAAAMATGHYVRRVVGASGPELWRGADPARDQSWFLYGTTRAELDLLRFPLGALPKDRTRALAAGMGLALADKPDSQDICFTAGGRYADIIARLRPEAGEPGQIVHRDGRVLGTHQGVLHFTVGQRKGLGGVQDGSGAPLYVLRLEPERARVVVGPRAALGSDSALLRAVNWLAEPAPDEVVGARVRSTRAPVPARVTPTADGVRVDFVDPEQAVAPGQACVLYRGEQVLGGGVIRRGVAAAVEPARVGLHA